LSLEFRTLNIHCPGVAAPVNRPQIASQPPAGADGRLYLRDSELDQGAALIRAAARRLERLSDPVAGAEGLSQAEAAILIELFDSGPLEVGELQFRLGAPKQTLARRLNTLEAKGMVRRTTSESDRRRRLVALTETSGEAARKATERRRAALREAFLSAGPEAVSGARRMLAETARGRGER